MLPLTPSNPSFPSALPSDHPHSSIHSRSNLSVLPTQPPCLTQSLLLPRTSTSSPPRAHVCYCTVTSTQQSDSDHIPFQDGSEMSRIQQLAQTKRRKIWLWLVMLAAKERPHRIRREREYFQLHLMRMTPSCSTWYRRESWYMRRGKSTAYRHEFGSSSK